MKKLGYLSLCIIVIFGLLTGCGNNSLKQVASFDKEEIDASVVKGTTEFAFDMFKQLNGEEENGNIFISPLSISTALSMTCNGARTTTKEAMAEALRYEGMDIEQVNKTYQNLLGYLGQVDPKIELNINNSIWIREGEPIEEAFISLNKDIFNADVKTMDFSKEGAADKINKWISEATKGKIQKMIEPPISQDVLMYLINAIYFKGEWTEQFDKKHTFSRKFRAGSGETKKVMMMSRKGEVAYGQGDDFKAVRLPYGNGKTAMYCILPDEAASINQFIAGIDGAKWNTIKKSLSETKDVTVQIPRFKMEYGIKDLKGSLTALGMDEAFCESADFSGIRDDVFIETVLHKAVIEVNEEGSEAAGATAVGVGITSNETAIVEPITFIGDRPFVFVIADEDTGTVLFVGKLWDVDEKQ